MRGLRFPGVFFFVVFFGVGNLALGQDKPVVPYVDRGTAQALVDTLTKENETLRADAARFRREASELTQQITAARKALNDLTPLLEEVRARNAELAAVAEPLVDRGLKARASAAAERNRAAEKRLVKRIEELTAKVAEASRQAEARLAQASVNEARASRNTDDIVILQATISKTDAQESQLQAVIDRIEGLSGRLDAALQQTGALVP